MTLAPKAKGLAAVAISVAAGCKPCTDHHVAVARKARATDEEIAQAANVALAIRRKAADVMEAYAAAHIGEASEDPRFDLFEAVTRVEAPASIGAAFAVNCVSSLKHHLAVARLADVSQHDVREIARLAAFIKQKAASHVERLIGRA